MVVNLQPRCVGPTACPSQPHPPPPVHPPQPGILDREWSRDHNPPETQGHSGFVRKRSGPRARHQTAAAIWLAPRVPSIGTERVVGFA